MSSGGPAEPLGPDPTCQLLVLALLIYLLKSAAMPPPRKASGTPAKRAAPQSKSLKAPEEGIQAVVLLDANSTEESTLEPLLQGTPQVRGAGSARGSWLPSCSGLRTCSGWTLALAVHLLWLDAALSSLLPSPSLSSSLSSSLPLLPPSIPGARCSACCQWQASLC